MTVAVVLLGVLLWTQMPGEPNFAATAQAQIRSRPSGDASGSSSLSEQYGQTAGVSGVGARSIEQRTKIIAAIAELQRSVDQLSARLASGNVHVQLVDSSTDDGRHADKEMSE